MRTSRFLMISLLAVGLTIVPRGTVAQTDLSIVETRLGQLLTLLDWWESEDDLFRETYEENFGYMMTDVYNSFLALEAVTNQLSETDQWLYRTFVTQFGPGFSLATAANRTSLAGYIRRIYGVQSGLMKAIAGDLMHEVLATGVWTWQTDADQTPLLTTLRNIDNKLDDLSFTNDVDLSVFTNLYSTFNESDFDSAGWSSLRELAVDYYDANYQEVSTNDVSMQEWTDLNIWERISTALYRLVMPQGIAPDTHNVGNALDSVGGIVEDNWEYVEDVDKSTDYETVFIRLAGQLQLFQWENLGDYNNLTLVPEFDWPIGDNLNYHFQGIIIHPSEDGVVRVIARLFRRVFGWLWDFLLILSFIYLTIGTSTGIIYLFTWASSCAGQLKILPFDWSKVWHNPFDYLKLGDRF